MENLQNKLLEKLKGYSFEELIDLLNTQKLPEVRETILKAMELYYEERFILWI